MTAEESDAASPRHVERLHRLERVFPTSPIYFVTACTAERRAILATAEVHEAFKTFARNEATHGVWIGAWVLMPDHLHLFVRLDDERVSFSIFMKSLKNALSKSLRTSGVPPPHWQKGFFDHVLRSDESYAQKWNYVRENPVRAGFVRAAADWPYQGEIHALELRRS